MGNRAVIILEEEPSIGIYLHWDGGPGSVLAFVKAARDLDVSDPQDDPSYAFAGLASIITSYMHNNEDGFGPTFEPLSVGIGPTKELDQDNYDNGVYVVGANWEIVGRFYSEERPINNPNNLEDYDRKRYSIVYKEIMRLLKVV